MPKKSQDDTKIRRQETQIPRLAKVAGKKAFRRAVSSGQTVLAADQGVLYEVTREGRRPVKKLTPAVKVKAGKVIKLR